MAVLLYVLASPPVLYQSGTSRCTYVLLKRYFSHSDVLLHGRDHLL